MKNAKVPGEYASMYYLRELDLKPALLSDYPHRLSLSQCRELYRRGWLFHRREDALRAREIMKRAYIYASVVAKGADSIFFDRLLKV